jgi:hypothetical protein
MRSRDGVRAEPFRRYTPLETRAACCSRTTRLGCACRRNCNVNLDDLRGDRPDLDCEPQQARGIPRNLQLDETGGAGVRKARVARPSGGGVKSGVGVREWGDRSGGRWLRWWPAPLSGFYGSAMVKVQSMAAARKRVCKAEEKAQEERARRERANVEDMAAFLVAHDRLAGVDAWEAARRRDEQRRAGVTTVGGRAMVHCDECLAIR